MAKPPAPSPPAEASPATPHDALFKSTFSKVEHARAILGYILGVASDMDTDEVCALIARATSQEIAEDVVTLAQKLREEGRNEGLSQGLNQGRTVGRLERSREIVGKLLRLKFRKLPASAQARLLRATEAQLDLWAERLLTASSLAEVMDG